MVQGDVIAMVTKTGGEKEDLELVETPDRMLPVIWTEMIGDSPRTTDYKDMSEKYCKGNRKWLFITVINYYGTTIVFCRWLHWTGAGL